MLYNKYLKMHLKIASQYKANMLFIALSQSIITIGEILAVFVLFKNFQTVAGWGFYEAALMFALITTSYSVSECFARGFDEFDKLVRSGELDRLLVRPVNIVFQVFVSKIEFTKLFRVIIGLIVGIIAIANLAIVWTFTKVLVLIAAFVCGIVVIFSTFLIAAGVAVFTIEKMEAVNIFTNGAKEICYYPLNLYPKWLTRICTFIIPLACFNYLPISYIMEVGSVPPILCALSPVLGILFIIPCLLFFLWSLKKYNSTGN